MQWEMLATEYDEDKRDGGGKSTPPPVIIIKGADMEILQNYSYRV